MSGFVVAFGSTDRKEVKAMMEAIRHRGPDGCGVFESDSIVMAQNYLEADGFDPGVDVDVPVCLTNEGSRICYDGQMGNWSELAAELNVQDGPLREERLLLLMYQRYGKEMLGHLDDTIFSFVIASGERLFAARDLLGIKTLFYGWKNGSLYLASELKSLTAITGDVYEFPPGCYMGADGRPVRYAELPKSPPSDMREQPEKIVEDIRDIIERSVAQRVDFSVPTGSLLSGGIDSSIVACLAQSAYKKKFGPDARLPTFALGVGESQDIHNARIVARHLDTDHHELIVGLEQVVEVLPKVIYHLESFDPSLVRSSVSNFLISRFAAQKGIRVLLSGEGGDEVFCGYLYLKDVPEEELFAKQMECMKFLHNNASLRLDRMNQCNSVKVVAPLISGELLNYSLSIPPAYKQKPQGDEKIEKWIFRKAFEHLLPEEIVWRLKQEFSQGSGSADLLPGFLEEMFSDEVFNRARSEFPIVRSKEELYYFRLFTSCFGEGKAVETVGQWISL